MAHLVAVERVQYLHLHDALRLQRVALHVLVWSFNKVLARFRLCYNAVTLLFRVLEHDVSQTELCRVSV